MLKYYEERQETKMTSSIWTIPMKKRLLELQVERDLYGSPSESEMATTLSDEFEITLTKDAVHGKLWRVSERMAMAPYEPMPNYEQYKHLIHDSSIDNEPPRFNISGHKKILHASDLHIPHHNARAVTAALNSNAAADLVVMSELMDIGSFSKWGSTDAIPLQHEVEETLTLLELMDAAFPCTILLSSNHENRIARSLVKVLPTEMSLLLNDFSILQLLARPFENVHVVDNWFVQVGDALFCHAEKYSSVSMKAAVDLDAYFKDNYTYLGVKMPYRVLVQAHTHHLGVSYKPDLKLFESGMLCQLRDWQEVKIQKNPWVTGYIVIEMEDGRCTLNKCREHVLPSQGQSAVAIPLEGQNVQVGKKREEKTSENIQNPETQSVSSGPIPGVSIR